MTRESVPTPNPETPGINKYWEELMDIPVNLFELAKDEGADAGFARAMTVMNPASQVAESARDELAWRRRVLDRWIEQTGGQTTLRHLNWTQFGDVENTWGLDGIMNEFLIDFIDSWVDNRLNMAKISEIAQDPEYLNRPKYYGAEKPTGIKSYIAHQVGLRLGTWTE